MKSKKQVCALSAAILMGFGCAAEETAPTAKITVEPDQIMVVCYSWGGNTRVVADKIVQITGGTFFEIKPVKAYPTSYRECVDQAKVEINAGFRPELAAQADLSKFSVIFVGSPNWYGTMAPPVATFLTTNDLKGKTIIPFFTHGGGGMQNCERDIKKLCSGAAVLPAVTYSGASVRRDNTQQLIAEWVASLLTVKK